MNDDLAEYLGALDRDLLAYLDANRDLSLKTAERLYHYAMAMHQGFLEPEHVAEDWADFFTLADAFVLAYGSKRLGLLNRRSALLSAGNGLPYFLNDFDRTFLVELVRELSAFVSTQRTQRRGTTTH
jgi:hypothetical protein